MAGLNARGAYLTLPLPDGRVLDVVPLTFGRARLGVSVDAETPFYDDLWDYATPAEAAAAAVGWAVEGGAEPSGWIRNPTTGRRRPGGDPAQEYVRW